MKDLKEEGWNKYSQYGEDGIIRWLIHKINPPMISVEIGMSGKKYSNTYRLCEDVGWRSIFIDKREEGLEGLYYGEKICKEVHKETIEEILGNINGLPKRFGVLSIDVDGEDYLIWEGIETFHPDIVIIETNPFYGGVIDKVWDGKGFGSSYQALKRLGELKGYGLACMSGNLIFVKREWMGDWDGSFLEGVFMVGRREYNWSRYIPKQII